MTDVRAFRSAGLRAAGFGRIRGRPGPDRRRWIIRPDDLLVVDIERINLDLVTGEGTSPPQLVRKSPGPAFLVLTLPPQHLTEIAYFTTVEKYPIQQVLAGPENKPIPMPPNDTGSEDPQPPPIESIIAGWSRLAFIVTDDDLPIDWTIEGILLAIHDLELSVPANALPRRAPLRRYEPIVSAFGIGALAEAVDAAAIAEPQLIVPRGRGATRIARDRKAIRLGSHALRLTEMTGSATRGLLDDAIAEGSFHIPPELLRPEPRPPAATQTALELPYRVILSPNSHGAWFHTEAAATSQETGHTELWHTRLGTRHSDGALVEGADPLRTVRAVWTTEEPPPETPPAGTAVDVPDHANDPWRMSLDGFDRHSVVHLSSNFRLRQWNHKNRFYEPDPLDVELLALSSLGGWLDSRGVWNDQPLGLSVEEWRHRATLGRDHYVRVVYAGRLFPLGHRASLVKITERQFHADKPGNPAYLRQRMFIIVREPLRTYRSSGLKYDGTDAARAGERWDLKLPFPAIRITTVVSPLLDPPEKSDIKDKLQGAFWPYVGNEPFRFHVVATDTDGHPVEMAMPLIFIGQEEGDLDWEPSIIPDDVATAYATATWPGSSQLLATVPTDGQPVAFAESDGPDDTTFAAQSLTFGAEIPGAATYDEMNVRQPRYVPVIRSARIDVPSLQAIARTTQSASVVFDQTFLRDAFLGANAGEVFLAADPAETPLGVKFSAQSDRSGGLVAPDMSMAGVSRITGPVSGVLDTAVAGTFDPGDWFGAIADAKLFGILKLSDILDLSGFDKLGELPRFIGGSLDQVQRTVGDLERLRELLATDPVPQTGTASALLDQLLDPTSGSVAGLLAGAGPGTVIGQLSALHGELGGLPAAIAGSSLGAGPRAVVTEAATSLQAAIAGILADPPILDRFAVGDQLPQAVTARFEWRPVLKAWPAAHPIFVPSGPRNLVLSVEAAGQSFTVTCSLDQFVLDLEVLILTFERVQFRVRAGKKPEVDVVFTGFAFAGPLSFVETLRELIPFDGFSDPPEIQVTPEGISAGFSMGLPNLAIGVFSLENLSLAAGFSVPFVGPPMSTWFRFAERENPARLTVSLFGGGFFFGVTVNADGLQVAEGAIEFGAAISVNFGVASGSVSAMAGLYFKIESGDVTLAGYFRLRGEVEALGIVSVCIELYLEMRYESGSGKCVGTATLSIEIEVALFSTTIEISMTKRFAGSGADPTLAELFDVAPNGTSADWNAYCEAFA
jgi:hypothetical protein